METRPGSVVLLRLDSREAACARRLVKRLRFTNVRYVSDTRDEERVTAKDPKDASLEGCLWPTLLDVSLHWHVAPKPAPDQAASRHRTIIDEVT